jgi:hypothetical protein
MVDDCADGQFVAERRFDNHDVLEFVLGRSANEDLNVSGARKASSALPISPVRTGPLLTTSRDSQIGVIAALCRRPLAFPCLL